MTQFTDQTLHCCDCSNDFTFTARDQDFFAQKGYATPRRCKSCRDLKKSGRDDRPRDGHAQTAQRAFPRPAPQAPVVQYRTAPVVQDPPRQKAVVESFSRSFGPDAPPKTAAKDDFRGKKGERRRDAYGERRQRKHRDWDSFEEE